MVSRRTALLAPLAAEFAGKAMAASSKMMLCIHQNTSAAAGYRKSLEGWAKAGIKNVELTDRMLEDFLKTDSIEAARRVVTDLGLTPVSCAAVLPDFWIPNQSHPFQFVQTVRRTLSARQLMLRELSSRSRQRISALGLQFRPSETNRRKQNEYTENDS